MLNSMTGYGSAKRTHGDYVLDVDVRSVNNKFLKINFRSPEPFSRSPQAFEDLVRSKLERGTVDLNLKLQRGESKATFSLQTRVIESYYHQLQELQKKLEVPGNIDLSLLVSLPGTVESAIVIDDEGLADALLAAALEAAEEAVTQLAQMRRDEGSGLEEALLGMLDEIDSFADKVEERRPELMSDYRDRLFTRVQELLKDTGAELAENDLIREVSVYAERSDVAEELQRLRSHTAQFRETCERGGSVGRRLEFIAQEMHREVNTMGSKANDSALSVAVLEMKGLVDRVKEQVLNAE